MTGFEKYVPAIQAGACMLNRYGPVPMDLSPPALSEEERSMLCRLPSGGCIERQKYIHFTFNGCAYLGLEGDTLASALLANRVRLVNRRWTLNRTPAGFGLGDEAPHAIVQVFDGVSGASNVRMNELALFEGLTAKSADPQPRIDLEALGVASTSSGFIPARLGDKAVLASRKVWNYFERHLFNSSGLQEPPNPADFVPDERHSTTCDVLVVGGGIAGLSAALAAGSSGARVLCVDEQAELGGWLLASAEEVDGLPAAAWVANAIERLRAMPAVTLLPRTTVFEYREHNQLMLSERRIEHLSAGVSRVRKCLWDVRAKQVVLATGSHERLLAFPKNDLPGVMLASAVSMYIRRFAVLPGSEAVVYTNNDAGYDAAFALKAAGAHVKVIDARALPEGPVTARAKALGIPTIPSHGVVEAVGFTALRAVKIRRFGIDAGTCKSVERLVCDLLVVSGGFSPVMGLHSQSCATPMWSYDQCCPVPGSPVQAARSAGSCNGLMDLEACALEGHGVGLGAAMAALH